MSSPMPEIGLYLFAPVILLGGFWLLRRKAVNNAERIEILLGMITIFLFFVTIGIAALIKETRSVGSEIRKVQFNVNVKPGPGTTFEKVEVK